ncbi:MAG: fluoride efflux transporter CrcB [Roseicyclus sp.]|nr:fluoride efflux transporter CrcB [Roseicyclus sp.]MBO6625321.1 fluoride efflux transporter CrcB [Roseicyclus sp.]MBO6922710.1 fluoride efflux transporter CrcB [Roseicyclus sp.]
MMTAVFQVALGGAAGAVLRYLTGLGMIRIVGHTSFPYAIITVNVLGSFLMGLFVVAAAHRGLTHLSPLVVTGFLGGFTTFSAFSLEAVTLYERGEMASAVIYVLASVGFSIFGLVLGLWLARGIFT